MNTRDTLHGRDRTAESSGMGSVHAGSQATCMDGSRLSDVIKIFAEAAPTCELREAIFLTRGHRIWTMSLKFFFFGPPVTMDGAKWMVRHWGLGCSERGLLRRRVAMAGGREGSKEVPWIHAD